MTDDADETTETITRAVIELLASGPRSRDDLVDKLRRPGGEASAGVDADVLDDVVMADPRFVGAGDRVAFAPALFDGAVTTHRVTAWDLERGTISIERNLGVLDWGIRPDALTINGRPCELRGAELIGPDGWLEEVRPGEVLAFRRSRSDLIVDRLATTILS